MFKVEGYEWFTEEDHHENGCDPNTGVSQFIKDPSESKTLDGLITEIATRHGHPRQSFSFQACEEPNRIDIQYLVDSYGLPASINEIRDFRAGKKKLWAAIATYYVYEYTQTPVVLPLG